MNQPAETNPPTAGRVDSAMSEVNNLVTPVDRAPPPPPPDTTRHMLSLWLSVLFTLAVLIGPVLSVVAIFYFDCCDDQDRLSSLIEKFTLLGTSLTGTVAGVFGSVMGFYFGREQAEAQNAKQ